MHRDAVAGAFLILCVFSFLIVMLCGLLLLTPSVLTFLGTHSVTEDGLVVAVFIFFLSAILFGVFADE